MSGKRLLIVGDMVWGMADPITPYVGQIVDESATAPPQTAAMEAASAPPSSSGCAMTVNGLPVAHAGCMSVATPPLPQAKPLSHCSSMTLNGKPLLLELGQFVASPSGSLSSTAVSQQSVFITKEVSGPTDEGLDEDALARAVAGGPPVRTGFGPPSAEHLMASRISSARLADLLPPEFAHLVGDPVDVATGSVVTRQVDDSCPKYDLAFERRYVSRHADRHGPLGWGWSHAFDQAIWLEHGRVVLCDAGRQIEFDTFDLLDQVARAGAVLRDATGRLVLTCHGRNAWELSDGVSTRTFLPMPGTASADKDRGFSRLATITRPGMPLTELHYDEQARISSVRCDGNAVFSMRYDRDGLLESLNDRVMRYAYSAAGDLIEARDLDGHARLYEYASHLLVRETNRRGAAFYYGYDGHGPSARCVRTWGDGGRLHRMLAYERGTTLVTDSLGERTSYETSAIGLVVGFARPDGTAVRYEHDDQLRLTAVRQGEERALDDFDEDGNRVKHREPGGAIWQMEYDQGGRLVAGIDPVGGRWEFGYDLEGQLTRLVDPEQHVYRMEYAQGRLSKLVDPLGRVVEFELGIADEVLAIRAPWQPGIRFEYDASGRLTAASTEAGDEARWYYDGLGRLVGAMRGGTLVQWRRDPEGALIQSLSDEHVETYGRDGFGRLERRHGEGPDVTYRYDTEDRCLMAALEDGPRVEFEHDAVGRVVRTVVDGTFITELERDRLGRVSKLSTDTSAIIMHWDPEGRLAACEAGRGERTYTYREDGLLASFATPSHACTLKRNALGVVVEQNYIDQVVASPDVDHRGNRYGVEIFEGPSVFYLWSSAGLLERIGLVGDVPLEIDLEHAADGSRGVARHAQGRGAFSNLEPASSPLPSPASDIPRDALHRPLADDAGNLLLWDESRVLREGASVIVHALPGGARLGAVRGEAFVFDDSASSPPLDAVTMGTDAVVEACGLSPDEAPHPAEALTPDAYLRHTFARRVWNEVPRPVAGRLPWNPDDWSPEVPEPAVGRTRLDQKSLMRWLSPFPAPQLRVLSEA